MQADQWISAGVAVAGVLLIAFVGKRAGWFKIIGGTNALLREQNAILTEQNITLKAQLEANVHTHDQDKKDWATRHSESLLEIAKLQGKVDTLTAVPLRSIDVSLKELLQSTKENAESNKAILAQLKATATIAAEDRDVLTNQDVHIKTEVHKIMDKDIKPKGKE